jgi:hypothetical protein
MNTTHRIDVHQHVVPPFWAKAITPCARTVPWAIELPRRWAGLQPRKYRRETKKLAILILCAPGYTLYRTGTNYRQARAPLQAIELLCNQASIPGQDGGGLGHAGNLCQIFPAAALADFGERNSLRIPKPEPGRKLGTKNLILGSEVLALEEQTLVHHCRDARLQAHPFVVPHCGRNLITAPAGRG